jgi:AGZA family xanthine/uracil permease-like MFS transporter
MLMNIRNLDFKDWTEALPAMMALFVMPFAYSIAIGIEFAFITYAAVKLASGRAKEVSVIMWVLAALFLAKELFL